MTSVLRAVGIFMLILNLPMETERTGIARQKFGVVLRINDLRMEIVAKKDH